MHADLESIVCKFGGDPAICVREKAICAKAYRRTDDGRLAIALAHSWNDLIKRYKLQGNGRRHVTCPPIRDAFSQQAADTIDWTVRCD